MNNFFIQIISFLFAVLVSMLVRVYIIQSFVVTSNSMMPTLHKGDHILIYKPISNIDIGDIVIFKRLNKPVLQVKRIKYLRKDKVFVEGDNQNNSFDSRDYGEINQKDIMGKVMFIHYPFSRFGTP